MDGADATRTSREFCMISETVAFRRQFLAAAVTFLEVVCAGILAGFTAILLPELQAFNAHELSWIASSPILAIALSTPLSSPISDHFGRRASFFLSALLNTIGWMLIGYSQAKFALLLAGRVLTGIAHGVASSTNSIYVGEVSSPKWRGVFLNASSLGIAFGPLICHALSCINLHWRTIAKISALIPLTYCALLFHLKESPVFYLNKRQYPQYERTFYWYRGLNAKTQCELQQNRQIYCANIGNFKSSLFIIIMLNFTLQLSGNKPVIFYTLSIVRDVLPNLHAHTAMIAIDTFRFLSAIFACLCTKHLPVRKLAMLSGLLTTITLLILAFCINRANLIPNYCTLIILLCYIIAVTIGLNILPWIVMGEIFSAKRRSLGGALSTLSYFLMYFAVIKLTPYIFLWISVEGCFAIFGGCTLIGTGVLYLILPETRHKTLSEIEEKMQKAN